MQIDIRVTEILSKVLAVDASSLDDALVIVEEMYKNQEIVLDYADFDGQVMIEKKKRTLMK